MFYDMRLWDTYRLREEEKEAGGAEGRQPSAHLPNLLLCALSCRMGEDGCGKRRVREENKRIGGKKKGPWAASQGHGMLQ